MEIFKNKLKEDYNIDLTEEDKKSAIDNLTNAFAKAEEQKKFSNCIFLQKQDGHYKISSDFLNYLKNLEFKDMASEIIEFGIRRYRSIYLDRYKDTNFQLYQKYTYEDVCRLLNWKKNMNAQNIGGYFYDINTRTMIPNLLYYQENMMKVR